MAERQPLLYQEDVFHEEDGLETVFPPPASMKKTRYVAGPSSCDIVLAVFMPWVLFTLVVILFVFAYQEFHWLVWALVAVCEILAILIVVSGAANGRRLQLVVGLLCLTAACVGAFIGFYIYTSLTSKYWALENGANYRNLSPFSKGSDHADAASITFTPDSFIDSERTLGYMKAGTVYCVAPVAAQKYSNAPQYWAAGKDCCDQRSNFRCGAAGNHKAKSGSRILGSGLRAKYLTAIRMAESVYNLSPTETGRIVLTWTKDPKDQADKYWGRSIDFLLTASVLYMLCSAAAGLILRKTLTS